MTNADYITTRRDVIKLAGGATAAAIATCALVPIAAKAASDPDAKLIALEREYLQVTRVENAAQDAYDKALFAEVHRREGYGDDYRAAQDAAENVPHVENLRHEVDALFARSEEIRAEIFATPASGAAGIAVKLRMATTISWDPAVRQKYVNGEYERGLEDEGIFSALLDCERLAGSPKV